MPLSAQASYRPLRAPIPTAYPYVHAPPRTGRVRLRQRPSVKGAANWQRAKKRQARVMMSVGRAGGTEALAGAGYFTFRT